MRPARPKSLLRRLRRAAAARLPVVRPLQPAERALLRRVRPSADARRGVSGAEVPAPALPPPLAALLSSRFAREGERKQVTVLFADIRGSTELIQELDPEAGHASA